METIKHRKGLKNHIIELYDSIDEMPIENFVQMEKNLIIEGGVGDNIGDFDNRLGLLNQFVSTGHKQKALNEINNMRNLFYNITNEVRPGMEAYSCLVYKIDGKEMSCTNSGVDKTTEILMKIGYTKKMIDHKDDIKKKMEVQLKNSFPKLFPEGNLQLLGAQQRKMVAQLDQIIDEADYSEKIERENCGISEQIDSKKFGGNKGEDIIYTKNFTKMCIGLQSKTNIDAKKLTIYDFYALIEFQKAA